MESSHVLACGGKIAECFSTFGAFIEPRLRVLVDHKMRSSIANVIKRLITQNTLVFTWLFNRETRKRKKLVKPFLVSQTKVSLPVRFDMPCQGLIIQKLAQTNTALQMFGRFIVHDGVLAKSFLSRKTLVTLGTPKWSLSKNIVPLAIRIVRW